MLRSALLLLLSALALLPSTAQRPPASDRPPTDRANTADRLSTASATALITDDDSGEPLARATAQLLRINTRGAGRRDTTFVGGTYADAAGRIAFDRLTPGAYLLRISFLGYKTRDTAFRISAAAAADVALGRIPLTPDAHQLAETVVTAQRQKMVVRDDTTVYNADAYQVPEGSVIEALVEALPGAKIDDDGKITINGKSVKKFKMDGRDFMTGNNQAVMKNLPSYVIDQVKAYEEKSDLAKATGLDDGNDDFVLEFVTKRSARKGLQANPDIGYGTDHRYGIRLTAMKPFGAMRYTFMGNANNVNDRNFSGRGGRGRGNGQGQRQTKTAALDASYENRSGLKWSGRVTWSRSDADNWSRTASESFVATRAGAFSNGISQSYSRNNNWTANMNLQWQIDSMTTLSLRPDISWQRGDNRSASTSASFKADPYLYTPDPLTAGGLDLLDSLQMAVNSRHNKALGYSDSKSANAQMQVYRRLGRSGRNVALSAHLSLRSGDNRNASLSAVRLYQQLDSHGNDSTYQTNRFTDAASSARSYSLGITYTEPLLHFKKRTSTSIPTHGLFLQLNYRYSYSYQKNDPATYDLPDIDDSNFADALNGYRQWTALFGFLDNPYEQYLSTSLSRYSERTEHAHQADLQLRLITEKVNVNAGVSLQPQRSHYIQQYLGRPVDTVRTVTNLSPTLNMRVRFNRQTNLQLRFRGQTQQPSITQLLDIYDDTNPLSITMGNPGLKPAFTTNLSANFQMQRQPRFTTDSTGVQLPKAQRHWSFSTNGSWQTTSNAIGNIVTYNETTGGRLSRPDNINGNWSASFGASFNVGLDTLNRWDLSGSVSARYDHRVGYVNLHRTATPDRNTTETYNLSPSLSLSFRNKWLSASLNGRTTYARTENRLQASNNLTTWNFSYGANTRITMPWGTSLSTDFHVYSKRGYTDASLNTDEMLWNAQLSQGFLRGRRLTVMLQWYDILRQQTNFSRTVNANGWRDQEVNAITSYAMLHLSYRLNFFGAGRQGARRDDSRREWGRSGGRDWGRGGGRGRNRDW